MTKRTSSLSKAKQAIGWKSIQKRPISISLDNTPTIVFQEPVQTNEISPAKSMIRSRSSSSNHSSVEEAFENNLKEEEKESKEDHFQKENMDKEKAIVEQEKEKSSKDDQEIALGKLETKEQSDTISNTAAVLKALQSYDYSDEDEDDEELSHDPKEAEEGEKVKIDVKEQEPEQQRNFTDLASEVEALEIASVPTPIKTSVTPTKEKAMSYGTYETIPFERAVLPVFAAVNEAKEGDESYMTVKNEYKQVTPTTAASISPKELNKESDSGISISQSRRLVDSASSNNQIEEDSHLAAIMSAVEVSVKNIQEEIVKEKLPLPIKNNPYNDEFISPEERKRASRSREFEYSIEDPIDLDMFRDNVIAIQAIDPKDIPANDLNPSEQEVADQPIREGMKFLFDNKFMKAKNVFQTKASFDPLYALGLGAMAFIKAMMTYHDSDIEIAMTALATAYTIAKTQIDNSSFKKPFKDTVSQYFTSFLSSNKTGLPKNPLSITMPQSSGGIASPNSFIPNGVLRAHVVKAECCLLMSVLQMTQESVVGYLKCGLNLRRAYNSYEIVWQEYKRMGQEYPKYMDRDTVSAIQFGIGAVHLILSSMPPKILRIFSALGWKSDKQLGFALLKLCLEGGGIRAPLASLTLLTYYSVLTSFAPQLYTKDMMSPAIECLLNAQNSHPSSCFFLFFAARIARVARNLPLSSQSFTFAAESSRGEWAEVAMKQMSDYEIGFNHALQLNWTNASIYFEQLSREKYWSPAFSKYFVGACHEMLGQRTEAILAFAQVPELAQDKHNNTSRNTYIDSFVQRKVGFFQKSGYQDMDFSLPALETILVLNAFEHMDPEALESCLESVQTTLEKIYEREKMEYNIRLKELVPSMNPPDYYDQRAVLLLTKASILNSLGRFEETIAHLNWVLDHKQNIKEELWVVPFTYWESGVTSWGLGNFKKSRKLWQLAMSCTKYDFEYRMAVRLSLALCKCDEIGVVHIEDKEIKGETTHGRKRMPVSNTFTTV